LILVIHLQKRSSDKIEENHPLEQSITKHSSPTIIERSRPLPRSHTQRRFSNNVIDPHQFVAKVVTGVTEQLKNDFPRLNSSKKEHTPPLVRKFTVPYPSNPSSYYNLHQQQ